MDDYVDRLNVFLRGVGRKGKAVELDELAAKVRKPKVIRSKLIDVLKKHPDQFALLRCHSSNQYTVRHIERKPKPSHEFNDPTLEHAFDTISAMVLYYDKTKTSWPKGRKQWVLNYSKVMGSTAKAEETLAALKVHKYVKLINGKGLTWDLTKVRDAAMRWSSHQKSNQRSSTLNVTNSQAREENKSSANQKMRLSNNSIFGRMFKSREGTDCFLIDNEEALACCMETSPILRGSVQEEVFTVGVACEGGFGELELLTIATNSGIYLFDCRSVGPKKILNALRPLLTSSVHIKVMHDLHQDAVALHNYGQIVLVRVVDTQLIADYCWGEALMELDAFLSKLDVPIESEMRAFLSRAKKGDETCQHRPLSQSHLYHAALHVSLLLASVTFPLENVPVPDWENLIQASELRASTSVIDHGARTFGFDCTNGMALTSAKLMEVPHSKIVLWGEPLVVESEVDEVIRILPPFLRGKLESRTNHPTNVDAMYFFVDEAATSPSPPPLPENSSCDDALLLDELSDVVLDIGRRPQCWINDDRIFLCDDESKRVTDQDVAHVEQYLSPFGTDNRAGIDGQLHRFSAIRNRDGRISGITIRIGRSVRGNAAMLMDILVASKKSILILGEPGSGKTTLVREATRILAERRNVVVVDTSNEIGGGGLMPHACIGDARRMMVPSLEEQGTVMVECVQNHTPHVMVIDEIGRLKEANAARTVKQRGVRMVASAHGDLRKLLKNQELSGLVGGVQSVVLGDGMAQQEAMRKQRRGIEDSGVKPSSLSISKIKAQRGGDPTFEVIVELRRGLPHEWRVVTDSAKAVDDILDGLNYKAQLRMRDPVKGDMRLKFISA